MVRESLSVFVFLRLNASYEVLLGLVGSEMCMSDSLSNFYPLLRKMFLLCLLGLAWM